MRAVSLLSLCVVSSFACSVGDVAAPVADLPAHDVAPSSAAAPTWFHDVEPIVQVECSGCHVDKGTAGFPLDQLTMKLLGPLVLERVAARDMPPWPPSSGGAPIVGARALDADAIATIAAWAAGGMPEGDRREHVERPPRSTAQPARPADLRLELSAADAYQEPTSPFISDEIRCFVLDLPPSLPGAWVTAARWHAAVPIGIHELGGVVVDADSARAAHARSGKDGRAGFECGGGLGELASGSPIGASGTGTANDGTTLFPQATAVRIPAGGGILMRVHYAAKHLAGASDRSGVDLWLATEAERRELRPLVVASVEAPVEVPCPSGISGDAANACSRESAFARLAPADPAAARARSDAMLASCGTTLDAAIAAARADSSGHFYVPTSCTTSVPWGGTIRLVHARMQTRGAAVRVEAERDDGTWAMVLDIPRWRWAWESTYLLEKGVAVEAGRRLRVSCTFDNGASNQWSSLTGEPGHDAPARPPLLAPGYVVAAPNRAAEACSAIVGIERTPYRNAAWPTVCHEAQAIVTDTCGAAAATSAVSTGCAPTDEDASAAILGMSPAVIRATYCDGQTRRSSHVAFGSP